MEPRCLICFGRKCVPPESRKPSMHSCGLKGRGNGLRNPGVGREGGSPAYWTRHISIFSRLRPGILPPALSCQPVSMEISKALMDLLCTHSKKPQDNHCALWRLSEVWAIAWTSGQSMGFICFCVSGCLKKLRRPTCLRSAFLSSRHCCLWPAVMCPAEGFAANLEIFGRAPIVHVCSHGCQPPRASSPGTPFALSLWFSFSFLDPQKLHPNKTDYAEYSRSAFVGVFFPFPFHCSSHCIWGRSLF